MLKQFFLNTTIAFTVSATLLMSDEVTAQEAKAPDATSSIKDIKSYCLDFNWAPTRRGGFAKPGTWKDADPAATVA